MDQNSLIPQRFLLIRDEDPTGVSGTGIVASGVVFPDGKAVMRWNSDTPTTVMFENLMDVEYIHGHNGKTHVEMLDR